MIKIHLKTLVDTYVANGDFIFYNMRCPQRMVKLRVILILFMFGISEFGIYLN